MSSTNQAPTLEREMEGEGYQKKEREIERVARLDNLRRAQDSIRFFQSPPSIPLSKL
jgi:hypothetical protein